MCVCVCVCLKGRERFVHFLVPLRGCEPSSIETSKYAAGTIVLYGAHTVFESLKPVVTDAPQRRMVSSIEV